MSEKYQDHYNKKMFLVAISAAVLVGSFVVSSQFVQTSMAQDLSQLGQQARERILGQQLGGGDNQTGNQTDNQTGNQSGEDLGQLGEQARNFLPGQ
jgi:hypothetical protein